MVSYPPDLGTWDPSVDPYFEFYGETTPHLCMGHLETVSTSSDDARKTEPFMAVYEYFWTLGVSEDKRSQPGSHLFRHDDPGAEVWLLFPRTGGWRICEVVAAIRYLRPLPHTHNLMEKATDYWEKASPLLDKVSNIAKDLPVAGAPTATLISMLAKMRLTSLPPVDGFLWSVDKVTKCVGSEVLEGVQWKLPKTIFTDLGGTRLTGSITVYFHSAHLQQNGVVSTHEPEFEQKDILARAIVHAQKGDQCVPPGEDDESVERYIKRGIKPCQSS